MKSRIDKIRKYLAAENIDAAFFAVIDVNNTLDMPNVRYLTGYSGTTGAAFITKSSATFISDFRYADQAKAQVKGCKILITKKDPIASLEEVKEAQAKNLRLAIEAGRLTITQKAAIQKKLPNAILIETTDLVENFGLVKEGSEIANIKAAARIADDAFERILGYMRPGISEKHVAAELEYQMKMLGSAKEAFETIVASGHRSAMPHGVASDKELKKGDFVTLDFGATVNGYCCDITRTVVLGRATSRQKKIYNIVLKAQLAAIRKVKAGAICRDVDAGARDLIKKAGYAKNFGHGTGHGIGLQIHTGPRVSMLSMQVLESNMVVTIEPGIYISGWGGVRIEDDVVVRPKGGLVINKSPKNLLEL
jgi:Xaa-Pro aminopeptidase